MSRTERRGFDLSTWQWTFTRSKRDDKGCRNPWCCGNAHAKAEHKRTRQRERKVIDEQLD